MDSLSPRDRAVACLRAFWAADLDATFSHLAPGAVFRFAPSMPYSAEAGRDWDARVALRRIIDDLFTTFDAEGPLTVELTGTLAEGTEVAVEYTARGTVRGGRVYANDYLMRVSVGADGLITRLMPYNDTRLLFTLMME
ncbi:nuclear transport factor 2 family protein [Sandaracinobacteroides saxicola]|uniref:Nuclear transport factor 2 family protein n=1 Tax=Sandaracinobacteroides saxicola TaxID=2759707 RepID=A0A7G5IIA1_9SPHN|nr:nuclear transport factor 2 family protein [Sandaracinobacteroides saxicola]QMW23093.1 nuclear transport factor 2 family protein [Sandaracinobacteroides saxicola]